MYPAVTYDQPPEPQTDKVIPREQTAVITEIQRDLDEIKNLQDGRDQFFDSNASATIPEAIKARATEAREAICGNTTFLTASKEFFTLAYQRRFAILAQIDSLRYGRVTDAIPQPSDINFATVDRLKLKAIPEQFAITTAENGVFERQLGKLLRPVETLQKQQGRQMHVTYSSNFSEGTQARALESANLYCSGTNYLQSLKSFQLSTRDRRLALQAESKIYEQWRWQNRKPTP